MTEPVYIRFYPTEDIEQAVQRAKRRYGDDRKFILVPASLWRRLVPLNPIHPQTPETVTDTAGR